MDNCNHAGIWQVNWPLVQFHLGDFRCDRAKFGGRIIELRTDKWFIPKFINFQYGALNPANRTHLSVMHLLEKEGPSKDLISPLLGAKDKDKDKDKDKETTYPPIKSKNFIPPTAEEVTAYGAASGFEIDGEKFVAHYGASNWMRGKTKITNWKLCAHTWKNNSFKPKEKSDVGTFS